MLDVLPLLVDITTSKSVPVCGIPVNSMDAAPPAPTTVVATNVIVILVTCLSSYDAVKGEG